VHQANPRFVIDDQDLHTTDVPACIAGAASPMAPLRANNALAPVGGCASSRPRILLQQGAVCKISGRRGPPLANLSMVENSASVAPTLLGTGRPLDLIFSPDLEVLQADPMCGPHVASTSEVESAQCRLRKDPPSTCSASEGTILP
jgi:hypothetical protein